VSGGLEPAPPAPLPVPSAPSPWNLPNALTVARIVMVPLLGWMLLSHPGAPGWRWGCAAVFVVAMLTDLLDGRIARARGLVTTFGKLVDPIADKAMTGMAFIGLSVVGELSWWVTAIILLREWGITLLRFVVLRYGVMAANRGGKLKTLTQTGALVLYLLPLPSPASGWTPGAVLEALSWALMGVALVLTVATGLVYLRDAARMRRDWLTGRRTDR